MNKSEQKKVPAKTDGKELVASGRTPEHEPFAVAHLTLTAPGQYLEHGEVRKLMSNAAVDLYRGLAPQDSLDALAATLAVSVSNASLDCLSQAARVDPRCLEHRDLNLKYGLKGATVAAELLRLLESRRGQGSKSVTVGNVKVEAGGQAIVGNVDSGRPRDEAKPDATPSEPHAKKQGSILDK